MSINWNILVCDISDGELDDSTRRRQHVPRLRTQPHLHDSRTGKNIEPAAAAPTDDGRRLPFGCGCSPIALRRSSAAAVCSGPDRPMREEEEGYCKWEKIDQRQIIVSLLGVAHLAIICKLDEIQSLAGWLAS